MFLFARFARLVTPLVLIGALVPADARAQTIPFTELSGRVKPGDSVSITGADGRRTKGRVTELTASSLTLRVNNERRTFPEATVRRVVVNDSLANGVLIGFAAGFASGAVIGWAAAAGESYEAVPGAGVVFGGLGAAIGAGVDGLFRRRINVSQPQSATFTVSPVVSPDRQAMLVSIRF